MNNLPETLSEIKSILDALTRSDVFKQTQHCHERIYKTLVNGYNYIFAVIQKKAVLEQGIFSYFLHHLETAKKRFEVKA